MYSMREGCGDEDKCRIKGLSPVVR